MLMEAPPIAVTSKRKASVDNISDESLKLIKCHKPSSHKFMVRLEISSPDSFSVKPLPVHGYAFPGEAACFEKLNECLFNVIPSHYTQNHGGGESCVFKLKDYDDVVKALKIERVDYEDIPYVTRRAVSVLSRSYVEGRWEPCRPEHLSDQKVDELMGELPKSLLEVLLPFQIEGVKFGLRRGGRCLIADEMGLGKTLQAIAIASCFMNEGSVLVVCPAIMRYTWAEELEHWLPSCLPSDIHLVFGHVNNPENLARSPKVVVISYTMLHILKKSILKQKWAVLIVDESHHVRCTKRKSSEAGETQAVLDVASKINHIILLSGTPSLSRPYDIFHQINILWPGLLGKDKFTFAKTYCDMSIVRTYQGIVYQDFSKGIRLEELNVLLKQTVMIRRLKDHVLMQLPSIRRQLINLVLKKSDIDFAIKICSMTNDDASIENEAEDGLSDDLIEHDGKNENDCGNSSRPSNQVIGIAKLAGFKEWLLMHPIIAESAADEKFDSSQNSHKMIIFVHYHKVTDRLQEFLCEKGIKFVRIDGRDASSRDRQQAINSFQHSKEVKIALVGILAGSSGLDLSAAQNVVFLELPEKISDFQQAESRAHRRGQTNAVNVYIFCAKDTSDETHWKRLNRSLHHTSSTVDGKYDSLKEIMIEDVSLLKTVEEKDKDKNLIFEEESDSEYSAIEPVICSQYAPGEDVQSDEVFDETTSKSEDAAFGPFLKYCYKKTANIVPDINNEENMASNRTVEVYTHEAKRDNVVISDTLPEADKLNVIEIPCDQEPIDQVEANPDCIPANSLRFEVSKYTGRIHLYSCIHGVETRPTPLFKNFRPEELETKIQSVDDKNFTPKCFKDDSVYMPALVSFLREWNSLRPVEQSKLYNKPLQLPLAVELCLNESQNHDKEGLLKGGSKKRGTSLDDISHPLPSNAVWKKVSIFHGKKERQYLQGWTLTGQPLCKLCQKHCTKKSAMEPEFFEDLFCDLECYEEYRLRTSNRYLRMGLAQIEHGICTNCHLDCRKLVKNMKPLSLEKRREFVVKEAPKLASRKNLLEKLISDPTEGNAWHADHIVPVYRGGGECRLENMRTLCIACHAEVTRAQCAERRSERAKAKKQLNRLLVRIKTVPEKHKDLNECRMIDSELLVNVPGSAYHTTNINSVQNSRNEECDKASEDVSS